MAFAIALRFTLMAAACLVSIHPAVAQDEIQARLSELMSSSYSAILRQVGSTARAGSAEWVALLNASVAAVLSIRPTDCPGTRYVVDLCGLRPALSVTTAMAPTLGEQEAVMVIPYTRERPIARGDVVLFEVPPSAASDRPSRMMFRVIGLPGETIALVDGTVQVDGTTLRLEATGATIPTLIGGGRMHVFRESTPEGRSYTIARETPGHPVGLAENAGPYRIPEGAVFLLGDNRHNAADSRYPDRIGGSAFVPINRILGRVAVVYAAAVPARIGVRLAPDDPNR